MVLNFCRCPSIRTGASRLKLQKKMMLEKRVVSHLDPASFPRTSVVIDEAHKAIKRLNGPKADGPNGGPKFTRYWVHQLRARYQKTPPSGCRCRWRAHKAQPADGELLALLPRPRARRRENLLMVPLLKRFPEIILDRCVGSLNLRRVT